MTDRKEIKPVYSGKKSEKLWAKINSLSNLKQATCYTAFVLLQNMEHSCLHLLNSAILDKYEVKEKDNK